jgi:hypothetical protein
MLAAAGAAGFVAAAFGAPLVWCVGGLILVALVPVLYSLVLYKRLEHRGQL